jgi:geranylgeranyl pyrophosphate synthase
MRMLVSADQVKSTVLTLPEMSVWPELVDLFRQEGDQPRADWQLPALACQAVGGDPTLVLPAVGAIACAKLSCILVDGILDEDPQGEYLRMGAGRAANLALGLLAAAFALIGRCQVSGEMKTRLTASLAEMALGGAAGQEMDAQGQPGEAHYWKVVRAKGSPFYAGALEIGALVGGADAAVARGLYDFGTILGEMVQLYDDLEDAFKVPAAPDWRRAQNNLLLLYAQTAEHPQREEFVRLLPHVDDPQALQAAQELLIRCGAVSYCVYHLLERYHISRRLLGRLDVADPAPLWELLMATQIEPLRRWLDVIGVAVPLELAKEFP